MFETDQRQTLLSLARDAIRDQLHERQGIVVPPLEYLMESRAAFVTLKIEEELRGCIGSVEASEALGKTIVHCAISAAFQDPRFPPLSLAEYPSIRIEISVLSPFQRISNPAEVEVGTHGILVTKGYHRGLLLPQVAPEYNWDRETFLSFTCRKAGLSPDAWKDSDTILEIFSAEVFGEGHHRDTEPQS